MPRWCVVPIGVIWLAAGVPAAQAQVPLTFEEALAMAREKAPRVAVARARIDETRGRLVGARIRFRDNPVLDVSTGPRKLETGTVTDYEFGLSQLLEPGGRRAARIAGAEAGITRETATSDATTRQIVRDVATTFVRALQAQARIDVLRATESVAQEAFEVADQRFRAGDIAVLEVNVARAAVARMSSQARAAEAERAASIGELKALLAWTAAGDPQPTGNLQDRVRDGLSLQVTAPELRPEVRALAAEAAEARADVRLGQAFKKPDVGLGFQVKREESHQAAAGLFSISLPRFNVGQEQIATGLARERRVDLERSAVIAELDVRARATKATFDSRVSAMEPIERDVLPGLEENERLARRSFEVGELSLPDLLVIRREFVDTRLQYVEALAEAALASIEWQMAAGVLR